MAYEFQRDEWRASLRGQRLLADCYRHHFVPTPNGGGVCAGCGMTLRGEEL